MATSSRLFRARFRRRFATFEQAMRRIRPTTDRNPAATRAAADPGGRRD
jgi:hypothetical protein